MIEGRPDCFVSVVEEDKATGIFNRSRSDAESVGSGVPDGGVGAVDESERAGGGEAKGSLRVNASCGPNGNGSGEGNGGEEGVWRRRWKKGDGESGIGRRPGLV